jgi:hypothetical protein
MLSLALVVTLGGIAKASYDSIMDWTTTALNPDLFVTASQSLTERNFRFPPALGDELAKIEGIDEVQRVPSASTTRRAHDDRGGGEIDGRPRQEPRSRPPEIYELAPGEGLISPTTSRAAGPHYGDSIELATPTGATAPVGPWWTGPTGGRDSDGPCQPHPRVATTR